jgi:hypothetical protein
MRIAIEDADDDGEILTRAELSGRVFEIYCTIVVTICIAKPPNL